MIGGVQVSRADFEDRCCNLYEEVLEPVRKCLDAVSSVDTLITCGGASLTPGLVSRLEKLVEERVGNIRLKRRLVSATFPRNLLFFSCTRPFALKFPRL